MSYLSEGGAYLCFGVGSLLFGVAGFGWWLIVVRRWAEPSNEADGYTN